MRIRPGAWISEAGKLPAVAVVAAATVLFLSGAAAPAAADPAAPAASARPLTTAEVIAATTAADWRPLDPANTLYLELPAGRVVIELAPQFAPLHAANLRQLARQKYFDGLAVIRSQDNFVVQWGDPDGGDPARARSMGEAQARVPPEFTVRAGPDFPFAALPDRDGYAPEVGYSVGFPAARDPAAGQAWLVHCYGMVGAGRGNETDSGNGSELYVVTGHAPRQLDRNIALVGRVVQGMGMLSTLPRGSGPMGFYEQAGQYLPIRAVRLAADLPAAERTDLEIMRTDTASFRALVEARRNRRDEWYKVPAGYVDVCNVPILARPRSR